MKQGISMVIATKGRVKLLGNLMDTIDIARKEYDGPSELIIVDDSNESDKAEILKLCEIHDAKYLFLTPSVCAKRNLGGNNALYPIILFLDSDCLVTPEILDEHERCYAASEKVGAVCGLLEFTGEDRPYWNVVKKSQFVVCFDMAKWGKTVPWGTTANFSIRKDVFEKIGGFDENFPNKPGGEDVDFGLNIGKAGYAIAANPKALVHHDKATWSTKKAMRRRVWYYGNADTYVMDKHPDRLLGMMPRRTVMYFFSLVISVLFAIVATPWSLLGFPLYVILDILLTSEMMIKYAPFNTATFKEQLGIQELVLINELGFTTGCVKRGKFSYLFKQLAYFENQLKGVAYNSSILAGVLMIDVFVFIAFQLVMMFLF